MNVIVIALVSVLITALSFGPAAAWSHSGHYGSASGGGGSWDASGYHGGSASGGGGSWNASNAYGGTASHTRGDGTAATSSGGTTAAHYTGSGPDELQQPVRRHRHPHLRTGHERDERVRWLGLSRRRGRAPRR